MAHFFEGIFTVWELVKSGGWMMLPIILSSVAALGIIVERLWTLRASRVTPPHLLGQVWVWIKDKQLDKEKLKQLRADSPLGEILAAGLANSKHGREIMKECIEEAAQRVIHDLEKYLNALGTIAAVAPLLGLL
ncbi:MAG: MotA/TolQ/ExbB proton channel family protein, partial [Pseudomonadales bacterium]|nr:MotA/TolQ/ExbB proton channel family protein [Pseudomonadales bacterium]